MFSPYLVGCTSKRQRLIDKNSHRCTTHKVLVHQLWANMYPCLQLPALMYSELVFELKEVRTIKPCDITALLVTLVTHMPMTLRVCTV